MGRAGGGSHGSSSHSSSSHSFSSSRSSSSHSFSSSGRSGRSSGGSYGYSSSRPSSRQSVHVHNTTYYGSGYGGYGGGYRGGYAPGYDRDMRRSSNGPYERTMNALTIVILLLIITALVCGVFGAISKKSVPASTVNRDKVTVNATYETDNVVDELGWIDNYKVSRNLNKFYETTGIQPYLVLAKRIDGVTGNGDAEEAYARNWYEEHINHEGALLAMYFDPSNGTDGNMVLVMGDQIKTTFDAEAEQIFWNYADQYWASDMHENELFSRMFTDTGKRIMNQTRTMADVMYVIAIGCVVLVLVLGVVRIMKVKRQHEAEKAAETERILKTPIEGVGDPLVDKYKDKE